MNAGRGSRRVAKAVERRVQLQIEIGELEDRFLAVRRVGRLADRDLVRERQRGWVERMDRVGATRIALGKREHPAVVQQVVQRRPGVQRQLFDLSDQHQRLRSWRTASTTACGFSWGRLWPAPGTTTRWYGPLKAAGVPVGGLERVDAIVAAVQGNGRHRNHWLRGQLRFDLVVGRITAHIAEPVAVRVDDDLDEVGIVEGCGGAFVGGGGKSQVGDHRRHSRRQNSAAILGEPGSATLGVEVVLVPEAVLLLGVRWTLGRGDVLNVVAAGGDQAAHPRWPQRRDDAGGPAAPVVADEVALGQAERIHEVEQILAQGRLLARTRRLRIAKTRRAVAAQIRHQRAAAGGDQRRHHVVVGSRVVREPVQQDHGLAAGGTAGLVGNVQGVRQVLQADRVRHAGYGRRPQRFVRRNAPLAQVK